jgi:sugar phosphate permease
MSQENLGVVDAAFLLCYSIGLFGSGYLGDLYAPRRVVGVGAL